MRVAWEDKDTLTRGTAVISETTRENREGKNITTALQLRPASFPRESNTAVRESQRIVYKTALGSNKTELKF